MFRRKNRIWEQVASIWQPINPRIDEWSLSIKFVVRIDPELLMFYDSIFNAWNIFGYLLHNHHAYNIINPAWYRWQARRHLPMEGGRSCKTTLHGGEDGESMLPLEYWKAMFANTSKLLVICHTTRLHMFGQRWAVWDMCLSSWCSTL